MDNKNMKKLKVAFICVHNSCRSQMAEAISKIFVSDTYEAYSAGTHIKNQINQDAVRLIKEIYSIDMEKTQHSKLLTDTPQFDSPRLHQIIYHLLIKRILSVDGFYIA